MALLQLNFQSSYLFGNTNVNLILPDLPRFCFSCGTEDSLMYENFKKFRAYAESIGFDARFEEVPGCSHEWHF